MTERVRVYRNLHTQCYSVQTHIPGVGWRVNRHVDDITLVNAEFKISEAGRQRVRREHRKNVHAYVYGTPTDEVFDWDSHGSGWVRLSYNPYDDYGFQAVPRSFWSPWGITHASHLVLNEHGMFAYHFGLVGMQNRVQEIFDKPDFEGYTTDHE